MQINIYDHIIGEATQLVKLVSRMKWLKKGSSPNEQTTTAESQPEPGQAGEHAAEQAMPTGPETLEQPDADEMNASMLEAGEEAPAAPEKVSGRRRERKQAASEDDGPKKASWFRATWFAQHWKTFAVLAVIFGLAFFARAYYGLGPSTEDGFIVSGGSDSYYHHYVITYGTDTGDFHFWDNMLNYPVGTRNPRPPFYDWSVALAGMGLSPLFDGDVYTSTFYVFLFSTALWGALTVFPTYFLAKEAFGKKAGIVAAFLLAIMPGHVQRSVLTNADHDAITLFFIVTAIFFFLKALKTMKAKEWVTSWDKPKAALGEAGKFFGENWVPVMYALLSGLSIAAVALIWQGFAYIIVLISLYFFVQIFINRFRNVDTFGEFALFTIAVGTGLLLAFPYYYTSIQIPSWFDTPSYLFLGLVAFALIMMATRKYPWFLVLSTLTAVGLLSIIMLDLFAHTFYHTLINALLSGGGYFINNKQYQTIAEAQAPALSTLALSFGMFTFWLSFAGVAWAAIQLPKSWKPDFTFMLLWAGSSIYMAVSAARFMFNASPAFAITAAWVVALIIGRLDIRQFTDTVKRMSAPHMSRNFMAGLVGSVAFLAILALVLTTVSSLAYPVAVMGLAIICGIYMLNLISDVNPSRIYSLLTVIIPASGAVLYLYAELYSDWTFTDATHIFILAAMLMGYAVLYMQVRKIPFLFTAGILFLAFCIVVPNVWSGLDAGIPYESKSEYDKEIYDAMPTFMQPSDYENQTYWYIGGFGYSLPLNSNYYPAAYDWLATQDANIVPASERPAFLSWWDYGFEVVNEGQHPTVADNFLGGHQLAGNVLMAQSEEDVIALVCVRILEGDYLNYWEGKDNGFEPNVLALLTAYGVNPQELQHIFDDPGAYIDTILANPEKYGPRDSNMQDANAKYIASRALLTDTLPEERLVDFYHDLSTATGNSIRYFGVDSRLFPFSAQNTGIFYAPAKLSDHRISETANQPYDFWQIKAVGEYGGEYDLDNIPPDVNLNQETPYKIVYNDMFYDSMLYKTFIGYSGKDIGQADNTSIPGYSGTLSSSQIMPGWNMTHFKLVHRTAYWNPYSAEEIQNHTDAWTAMNYWDAKAKQDAGDGISDLSDRSAIYQGVMMLKYYDGAIISGKVVLDDGTPVGGVSVTVSDEFGIPHQRVVSNAEGKYSIIAPAGEMTLKASTGTVDPLTLVGTAVNTTILTIEDYQAMRDEEDRDGDGTPDYLISQNLVMKSGGLSGKVFWDVNGNGTYDSADEAIGKAKLTIASNEIDFEKSMYTDGNGAYSASSLPAGAYTATIFYANETIGTKELTVQGGVDSTSDISIAATTATGTVTYEDGTPAQGAAVGIWNQEERMIGYVAADANGTYEFDNIMFGSFFAQAYSSDDSYASQVLRVNIVQQGNNTFDFTLVSAKTAEGTVSLNSVPVPYATIRFSGESDAVAKADASGHYSIVLRDGVYTVSTEYARNGQQFAFAETLFLDESLTADIALVSGATVSGKIRDGSGLPSTMCEVTFENQDSMAALSAVTDNDGDYSILLPQGAYLVQVSSAYDGSYYAVQDFAAERNVLDISLKAGRAVSGSTFRDLNGNHQMDAYEQIYNTRVLFEDPTGSTAVATSGSDGTFSIILPTFTPYRITFERSGFETVDYGTYTPAQLTAAIDLAMTAIPVTISGKVMLGGSLLTGQNIHVMFASQTEGLPAADFQVARDGTFTGSVAPGIYRVSFTKNITEGDDSEVYQIQEDLLMDTGLYAGGPVSLTLNAVKRNKVTLAITNTGMSGANVSFRYGPEDLHYDITGTSGSYYAQPGSYVLSSYHAVNDTVWLDMQDIVVPQTGATAIPITLKMGVAIQGILRYSGQGVSGQVVNFRDLGNNGTVSITTQEGGLFELSLVPGHRYEASADYVEFEKTPYVRAYRYVSTGTVINMDTVLPSYTLNLDKVDYSVNINGNVLKGDAQAAGTQILFIAGFGNYSATTDNDGNFTVSLPPADYTIYAYQPSTHSAVFEPVSVGLDESGMDIGLYDGYQVYGTAYYDLNQKMETKIVFTSRDIDTEMAVTTDVTGYYETWLPEGNYTISGSIIAEKGGVDITYSVEKDIALSKDTQLNLALSMKEDRVVFISVDPTQMRETPANSTVRYSFGVENLGNIKDTYTISGTGGDPDWILDFDTTTVTLEAGQKTDVFVNIFIPPTARVDYSSVSVTATSQKDPAVKHTNSLNCIIIQKYGISIEPTATASTFDQGDIGAQFSVTNTGNGADKCTLYIGNTDDLEANGWSVTFGTLSGADLTDGATRITNVSLGYGASSNVPLVLTPLNDNPSRQASVLILGYSQGDSASMDSQYIIVKYPTLQAGSSNLTVTGLEVSEQASGEQLTNISVMVISVVAALGLFYYARKRRWIR